MTKQEFYRELGNIDPKMIEAAAPAEKAQREKRSVWVKWVSVAACLFLIVMGGIFGSIFRPSDDGTPSYFVITARAADGKETELGLSDRCFNSFLDSTPSQGNIFGVDMPIFSFSVSPSGWEGKEAIYSRFVLRVSYNGKVVDIEDKDEHVMVAYLISTEDPDAPWAYSISGWFTEPTDMVVTIVDKESREIVETITVNVNYIADRQGYELEITNLNTKYAEQKKAVEANNRLMVHFFSMGYVTDYPEWFGGCYIESGKLYVKLVSPSEEERKNISKILASYGDVVVYKNAEISMAELQAYADETASELRTLGCEVVSWYVDSVTGDVVISVLEKDCEAAAAWVAEVSEDGSYPKIVIKIGEYTSAGEEIGGIEFRAEPFLEHIGLSWIYSMDVKMDMDNGKIYLNDVLYDQISYVEDFDLDYGVLSPWPRVNESITEELDKINSQTGCYLLETQSESKYGQKIAMYVIGDTYYFLRFFEDGTVMRIHRGTIQ